MKPLTEQLFTYRQQHTKKINLITHYIGIPIIIFSLMIVFHWVSIDIATKMQITFSWIFLSCTLIYYFLLNFRLALCAALVMIPLNVIAAWIAKLTPTHFSATLFLILFITGWILQFIGHFFEKQKPAFFLSATQLLIGPLFVLIEALKAMGIAKWGVSNNIAPPT